MAQVLSQDEVDALLTAVNDGDSDDGGGGEAPRPCAARSPELWFGVGSAPKMSHVAESERARSGCGI